MSNKPKNNAKDIDHPVNLNGRSNHNIQKQDQTDYKNCNKGEIEATEPQSPLKGRSSCAQDSHHKSKNAREDKRNMMRRVIKEKLFLSNINDLVLCDIDYNYGLFGCINDDQELQFPGISCAPGLSANAHKDENQLLIGQALKSFGESSNMTDVLINNGPLSFLAGMSQDNDSGSYGYNLLGYCGVKKQKQMTNYQTKLADHFERLRQINPDHFKGQTKIKFSDLFRFRGLLGQGAYGVVLIVQDKIKDEAKQSDRESTKESNSNTFKNQTFDLSVNLKNQGLQNESQIEKTSGSQQEQTYALKVINKSALHPQEINALKQESSILRDLVGTSNVVQFLNIFETNKYIIIQMEHLKGMQMKREMRQRTSQMIARLKTIKQTAPDTDSDNNTTFDRNSPTKPSEKKAKEKNEKPQADQQNDQIDHAQLMFKFGEPLRFWKHQLSYKENEHAIFGKPLYSEEEAAFVLKAVIKGLNNIHEKNYIHRDLKPENIQLAPKDSQREEDIKIIDFGLSAKQKYGVKDNHEEKIGTVLYMAPEQISSKSYSKKIDVYSVGIILYWMLTGHHPLYIQGPIFPDSSLTLKMKVASIGPHDWIYPSHVTPLAKDFICKLCQISQVERYDTKRALNHPWLTRRFSDKIPLTAKEEGMQDELEQFLHVSLRSVLFLSIIKKKQFIEEISTPTSLSFDLKDRRLQSSN